MELIETIICYWFGLTNIFLLLYLMIYIFLKRKSYPYSKTSPYCSMLFIFCILLHQLLYFVMSWFVYRDNLVYQKYLKTINSLNTHIFFIIPIIFKINKLQELAKFNYNHLTFRSQSSLFPQDENEDYFNSRLAQPDQDFEAFLFGLLCFLFVNIFVIFFLSYKFAGCFLFNSFSFSSDIFTNTECNYGYNSVFSIILKSFFFYGEIIYFIYQLAELWKYPLQNDILYIRFEMLINLIWFIFHHIYHFYAQFNGKTSFFGMFLFNDVIDFTFVILQLFLVQIRQNLRYKTKSARSTKYIIAKPHYVTIMNRFSQFMRNYICFSYFKKYLKETAKDKKALHLLNFWVDYYLYKIHLKNPNILKKTDLIIHAYYIYCYYFKRDKTQANSSLNIHSNLLEIPLDMLDKIEKASQKGFCMARTDLDKIYDEAFGYIDNKLYNKYISMISKKNEQQYLTNLFLHTEFDEVKEEVVNENESFV